MEAVWPRSSFSDIEVAQFIEMTLRTSDRCMRNALHEHGSLAKVEVIPFQEVHFRTAER